MARKRPPPPPPRAKEPRVNRKIRASQVKLVIDGSGITTFSIDEAIRMAESQNLDLVEVSANQDPPVCKIIDYGKWKFEQQKKKKEQAKNQHVIEIKEIKLRPKIGQNDYEIKLNRAISFLEKGDKVKVTLRFRGREIAHADLGMKLLDQMTRDLSEYGSIEVTPKMEGRQVVMVVAPKPGIRKPKADSPKPQADSPKPQKAVAAEGRLEKLADVEPQGAANPE